MKFKETYKRLLERVRWEESQIPFDSVPLQRLLLKNREATAEYGFVLFSPEEDLSVDVNSIPRSIETREGVKQFVLQMFKELRVPKSIRGKFIKMVEALRYVLLDHLEGI